MTKIRLTKEFSFEAAHALYNYDGKCSQLHGHSYKLFVTIIGTPITDQNNPKLGMVMDFGLLKQIVNTQIINPFDHSVIFYNKSQVSQIINTNPIFKNTHIFNFQPTCENLITHFAEKIAANLPTDIKLHSLKLYETASSYAEWYAEDNQ